MQILGFDLLDTVEQGVQVLGCCEVTAGQAVTAPARKLED
jgi:hypothetical protein